jgi:hypothetical protein
MDRVSKYPKLHPYISKSHQTPTMLVAGCSTSFIKRSTKELGLHLFKGR